MSSQTVATSIRGGLPSQPHDPPNLQSLVGSDWPDHMNDDTRTTASDDGEDNGRREHSATANSSSWSNVNTKQRDQAVGNLLAALVPVPSNKPTALNRVSPEIRKVNGNPEDLIKTEPTEYQGGEKSIDSQEKELATSSRDAPEMSSSDILNSGQFDMSNELHNTEKISKPEKMDAAPPSQNMVDTMNPASQSVPDRREIEAFAKIEFEDGNYYITTYAVELGRDALAYKAALARAEEAKNKPPGHAQSSSGRVSRPSDRVRRPGDSQVQGSVVSEAGGFGGVDEDHALQNGEKGVHGAEQSRSSQASAGSVVKPQEVLINPPSIPFDYHKNAERQAQLLPDNEKPAPVTADHLPKADTCPLIPIHATTNSAKSEVETHKGISRRHVKIEWDWDRECFKMTVLGRNGAFLNGKYVPKSVSKKLTHGSTIQISDVCMTFLLPNQRAEHTSDDSDEEELERNILGRHSTSQTSNELDGNTTYSKGDRLKSTFSDNNERNATQSSDFLIGPDGLPVSGRKRGPGRPPKDGIMSTRERREREKAQKMADAKAANGGQTPPPSMRGKFPKPPVQEESVQTEPKPEKRKYKKRKRIGEDGDVLPSIEGGEVEIGSETEKTPVKKARASKSPSPGYPPVESLTEEQLARPSEPYARLIYDILIEIHPKALPLKQIYRALKMKFPFFVYRVDSEGWQSSVRHNLNQEWNKLFDKGEKEGKGFAWKAIPGALQPQAERKRAAQQAAAAKPKQPTISRNQAPPHVPQSPLNWQNNHNNGHIFPAQQNGMPPRGPLPFFPQGNHPQMPPQNGLQWPPNNAPPAGVVPQGSPSQQPFNPSTQQGIIPPPRPGSSTGPTNQSQTQSPHPQSSQRQPPPPPPQQTNPSQPPNNKKGISGGSAAKNMPCTVEGLLAIKRFESAMYDQVQVSAKPVGFWQGIFASAKSRVLHGAPESTMPGPETKEEMTIMEHLRMFVEKFKNPNFVGHTLQPLTSTQHHNLQGQSPNSNTASPAPVSVPVENKTAETIPSAVSSNTRSGSLAKQSNTSIDGVINDKVVKDEKD